jgi:hypothetical protein
MCNDNLIFLLKHQIRKMEHSCEKWNENIKTVQEKHQELTEKWKESDFSGPPPTPVFLGRTLTSNSEIFKDGSKLFGKALTSTPTNSSEN